MSWIRIVSLGLSLLSLSAVAQRHVFNSSTDPKAQLLVHTLPSDETVAPIELNFTLPSLNTQETKDGFSQISVEGLASLGQPGRPDLYTTGTLIAVPEGFRPEIRILNRQETILNSLLVAPFQEKFRCDCELGKTFAFDSALYQSPASFPPQEVVLEEVGYLQSLRLMRVGVYPIHAQSVDKTVRVTHQLKIQVRFVATKVPTPTILSSTFYGIAKKLVSNAEGLNWTVLPDPGMETLLVITPESLKSHLAPFVAWKRSKGIFVDVVTYTEAGGSREKMQSYIQQYYNEHTPKPSYLLLVGNKETIPPYIEETTTGGGKQMAASDYPFSLLSGNDTIPDILYGRLLADNGAEVEAQISRWIEFEKTPESADWYSKGLTIASNEKSGGPSDKEYAETIQNNLKHYTYQKVDAFLEGEQTATSTNILAALSEGRSWLTYIGHGSGLGWGSTNGAFNITTVENLTYKKLPVIIDVACSNANYVKYEKPFGKAWVTQQSNGQNSGAVGYYGGSVNISWDPPALMAIGISKYHFEKPIYSLGGSVFAGQLYLIEQKGNNKESLDNLRWYQLFGDPSLVMRTAAPSPLEAKIHVENIDGKTRVLIHVEDRSGKALNGILASISLPEDSRPMAVGKTNLQGDLTLSLDQERAWNPESVLTLTGYNTDTFTQRIGN